MDIVATSQRAGAYCWAETQLFETLGAWLHEMTDATTVVYLGERCARHGERAQEWASRIAEIPGIDAATMTTPMKTPGSPDEAALYAALRSDRTEATSRVAHYEKVAANLAAQYRELRKRTDPLVDGPTVRLLERALA